MAERDIVVPELDADGRLTAESVIEQIGEIAAEAAPPVDLSGEGQGSVQIGEGFPLDVGGGSTVDIPGASAAGVGSVAIGSGASAENDHDFVLGAEDHNVKVPGTLSVQEPTEPQHAATKKYVDENAGGGGGVPGIAAGPGRPDMPETLDAPLPWGTVVFISTDFTDMVALWVMDDGILDWRPLSGTFFGGLDHNDGLLAGVVTTGEGGTTVTTIPDWRPSATFWIDSDGTFRFSLIVRLPMGQTTTVPEGGYLAIVSPPGLGLTSMVDHGWRSNEGGAQTWAAPGAKPVTLEGRTFRPLLVSSPEKDGSEHEVVALTQWYGEPVPEANGVHQFAIRYDGAAVPAGTQWPHVPPRVDYGIS